MSPADRIDEIRSFTVVAVVLDDAQTGQQCSIYSPPFYSSPEGYKMCLRLYPMGDGNAHGSHMSLFFVLMRGEFDAILKFPFTFKVMFCLFDQSGHRKQHVIDSFVPDPTLNSFQRPRTEMNIASGISKFIAFSDIRQANSPYVRDDTMFIKVFVDFSQPADPSLGNVTGLNPALSTNTCHTSLESPTVQVKHKFTEDKTSNE
jgi:hypothetical protein